MMIRHDVRPSSILLGGALLMTSRVDQCRSDSALASDKTTVRTPLGEFRV